MRNSYLHAALNQEPKPKAEAKPAPAEPVLNDGLDDDTGDFTPSDAPPEEQGAPSDEQGAPSEEPNPTLAQRLTALEQKYELLEKAVKDLNPTIENENPPPSLEDTSVPPPPPIPELDSVSPSSCKS